MDAFGFRYATCLSNVHAFSLSPLVVRDVAGTRGQLSTVRTLFRQHSMMLSSRASGVFQHYTLTPLALP